MKITTTEKNVYIWLTQQENECENIKQEIQTIITENPKSKVCIFISGKEDLFGLTNDLICHNLLNEKGA